MSNKSVADSQIFGAGSDLVPLPHAPAMYTIHDMMA